MRKGSDKQQERQGEERSGARKTIRRKDAGKTRWEEKEDELEEF